MSFTNSNEFLIELLARSGSLENIIKQAQSTAVEARELARSMARNLLVQDSVQSTQQKDSSLYAKDLEDLTAFLNYVSKNQKRAEDGHLLAFQSQGISGQQPEEAVKDEYMLVKGFWVHKSGLLVYLTELENEAEKPGQEVFKAMLGHVMQQASAALKVSYNPQDLSGKLQNDPNSKNNKHMSPHMSFKFDESTVDPKKQNDAGNQNLNINQQSMAKSISSIKHPFASSTGISPYDMTLFIRGIADVVGKYDKLQQEGILSTIQQEAGTISQLYTNWKNYIGRLAQKFPTAATFADFVPYDIAGTPKQYMYNKFGSKQDAITAAQFLLQMVEVTIQALSMIERVSSFKSLMGEGFFKEQISRAQSFQSSLQSIANS